MNEQLIGMINELRKLEAEKQEALEVHKAAYSLANKLDDDAIAIKKVLCGQLKGYYLVDHDQAMAVSIYGSQSVEFIDLKQIPEKPDMQSDDLAIDFS